MPVAEAEQLYNIFYFFSMHLLVGYSEKGFYIQIIMPVAIPTLILMY